MFQVMKQLSSHMKTHAENTNIGITDSVGKQSKLKYLPLQPQSLISPHIMVTKLKTLLPNVGNLVVPGLVLLLLQ